MRLSKPFTKSATAFIRCENALRVLAVHFVRHRQISASPHKEEGSSSGRKRCHPEQNCRLPVFWTTIYKSSIIATVTLARFLPITQNHENSRRPFTDGAAIENAASTAAQLASRRALGHGAATHAFHRGVANDGKIGSWAVVAIGVGGMVGGGIFAVLGLSVFQQITGINTVIYYSPTIFKFAGVSATGPAILAGAGLTAVMWLFHMLGIFLIDRVGRRPLLLSGIAGQIIGLAILGAAFGVPQLASFKSEVAVVGLLIYVSCFAFGLGPIFWLLISEIYPLNVRGAAMSAVTMTNWALNLVAAVTFLTLVGVLGRAGTLWLYGVIGGGAWVFVYLLVPETKGKTLEQIEAHWRTGKSPLALGKNHQ